MMKKKVYYVMIIISMILLALGIYFLFDNKKEPIIEQKPLNVNEASQLLYQNHGIVNNEQYYYFVDEDKEYFSFKLSEDTQGRTYLVNKITGEILVSYTMQ